MSRGVPLPRLGSPKDLVLRGLLQREWVARATEVGLLARLVSAAAGVEKNNLDVALELYFQEITHRRYTPEGGTLAQETMKRLQVLGQDTADELQERLKRVAALNSTG